ncbi:MAG: serine/threonine protein kinase [Sandaracinaceae bacterium]|nr:serine/threonine protein kinase [Sandaracinaceae bacterium]
MTSSATERNDPLGLAATMAAFPEVEAGDAKPPPAFPTGAARYSTTTLLGQGGMGTVHVARDGQFGREVALKEMTGDGFTTDAVRRFLVEALVTGNLEHPGIAAVYERGVREGRPFYTMRKVAGRTLASAVAQARTFEARLALLPSVVQVAHTLGFAHERGVVHRDVKPDNVVLGAHGETVLLDWGIARVRGTTFDDGAGPSPELQANETAVGAVMGTPAYMAPEQAAGRVDQIDERTDVFALGAMLYHVLSGTPPYDGPTGAAVLTAALEAQRAPLARSAPKTPPELQLIVDTAMARERSDRYPNAGAFAEALQDFLTSKVRDRPSPFLRAVGTAIGLIVLVVGLLIAIGLSGTISSFAEQGWAAYTYVGFAGLSFVLAVLDWRSRGRAHLAPLVLAFAGMTMLAGFAGTASGFGMVVHGVGALPPEEQLPALFEGLWEVSGNLSLSAFMASLQLVLWALLRRSALIAEADAAA